MSVCHWNLNIITYKKLESDALLEINLLFKRLEEITKTKGVIRDQLIDQKNKEIAGLQNESKLDHS